MNMKKINTKKKQTYKEDKICKKDIYMGMTNIQKKQIYKRDKYIKKSYIQPIQKRHIYKININMEKTCI